MRHVNPTTEESVEIPELPVDAVPEVVRSVKARLQSWASLPVTERVRALKVLPSRLLDRKEECAAQIGREMGKPLSLARTEVERTAAEMKFLLEHAEDWLKPEEVVEGLVQFAPLGVAAVISPWNFPLLLPLRGILPALLAGNGVVVKPSELTPNTGRLLVETLWGLDPRVREVLELVIGGKDHGRALVESDVQIIAFTGSTVAGKHIAKVAADKLKRVVLELGGLDAAIVLKDADVPKSAIGILQANTANSGQVCNAVKRVFVEAPVFESFVSEIIKNARKLKVGAPESDPDLGPLVSEEQLRRVERFIEDAQKKGAHVLNGGKRVSGRGYFFEPTVLVNVTPQMDLMQEEPFGPVLPIVAVQDASEAVRRANDTRYGLTASIWTTDTEAAKQIASQLDVGTVGINSHRAGGPGCPWGGAKESGVGRMKTREGLREFTNIKLVRWD